jgi:hypothetical protein
VDCANNILDTNLRFHKVAVGSKRDTSLALIFARECCHHDDFYVFGLGGAAQNVQHVKTTDLWHHYITDNEVRTVFDGHSERFFAVAC